MTDRTQLIRKLIVFGILTFAISTIFYVIMFSIGTAKGIGLFWMWSPGLAAILTQSVFKGKISEFGWRLGPKRYLLAAALIPIVYSTLIYAFTWLSGLAGYRNPSISLLIGILPGFVFACFAALGEEIGWRGFLVPQLIKITSFNKTVLITWVIWSLWHYPAIFWADYHSSAPRWFDLISLTIAILGMSAMTAWMRLRSGSIWGPVIWHGMHNLLIQAVFLSMTVKTAVSAYIVDDFGLGVLISGVVMALVFLGLGYNRT